MNTKQNETNCLVMQLSRAEVLCFLIPRITETGRATVCQT